MLRFELFLVFTCSDLSSSVSYDSHSLHNPDPPLLYPKLFRGGTGASAILSPLRDIKLLACVPKGTFFGGNAFHSNMTMRRHSNLRRRYRLEGHLHRIASGSSRLSFGDSLENPVFHFLLSWVCRRSPSLVDSLDRCQLFSV